LAFSSHPANISLDEILQQEIQNLDVKIQNQQTQRSYHKMEFDDYASQETQVGDEVANANAKYDAEIAT